MTVVVPAYNAAAELARSVPAVLALDDVDAWVWVDDGSTDGTASQLRELVAAEPRAIVVVLPENRGRASARNAGAERAAGETVLFLDADVTPPSDLASAMRAALQAEDVVAAVPRLRPLPDDPSDPYAVYLRRYPRGLARHMLGGSLPWRHFLTTAVAIRRSALGAAGGFDETVDYGEDIELASRLARRHPSGLAVCDRVVELRGVDSLDGVLGRMDTFGRALASMPPRVLETAGLEVLAEASWRRRIAGSPALAAAVRRALPVLPERGVALGVRYLLAHALARAYDASDSPT